MSFTRVLSSHKPTRRAIAFAWSLALGYMLSPAGSIAQTNLAQVEVEHLLTFVAVSNCEFYRNGTWYDANQAQAHLREKLSIVTPTNHVLTAEEFIEKVATKSAFTGIAYQIRCAGDKPVAVSEWLLGELRHYRQ
jgi:Family of unknown function (DUF5329)